MFIIIQLTSSQLWMTTGTEPFTSTWQTVYDIEGCSMNFCFGPVCMSNLMTIRLFIFWQAFSLVKCITAHGTKPQHQQAKERNWRDIYHVQIKMAISSEGQGLVIQHICFGPRFTLDNINLVKLNSHVL